MNKTWQDDGRKIPDEVMDYLREIAVRAVEEKGYSPEEVIDLLGLSRSCIYTWLRRYRAEGLAGLKTRKAPGAEPVITQEMEDWLRDTVLDSTPADYGYDTVLWTRDIVAELVNQRFGIVVSGRTVSWHLRRLGLSYQKPRYQAAEQDSEEISYFLQVKFPMIQRLAHRLGAAIAFEDESGVNLQTHAGSTWGEQGHPPVVRRTAARGGFNVLSTVEASGHLHYHVEPRTINTKRYLAFLRQLLRGRTRPLILLVDHASFHQSKQAREFVRAHRHQIRIFFLPRHAPEHNPDEHVWEEIKTKQIGRQPVKNKADLKKRLHTSLKSLQHNAKRIMSFFHLPDTRYAANPTPVGV